jgi:hypothetical protein
MINREQRHEPSIAARERGCGVASRSRALSLTRLPDSLALGAARIYAAMS